MDTERRLKGDVSKSSDCLGLIEACVETFGKVDILHNNIGIEIPAGIWEISEENWDKTMAVNLKSVFLTCKYALPHMEQEETESIVNISSINAITTITALSGSYAASKAGMIALTREIAVEYYSKGIRANAILPAIMNTPFVVAVLTETWGGNIRDMIKTRDPMCPTGKQGESSDVANAARFLASDEAKYVTGTTLVVDEALTSMAKTS